MNHLKHLLVPTDFSRTSDLAVRYAIDTAPPGAAVHLVHVIDDVSLMVAYPDGFYVELPGRREQLIEEAQRQLNDTAKRASAAKLTITTEALVGRPVAAIVRTAKARNADLIVMGTHGRSGVAHALLGSVAERVVRSAPCPVLTIRDASRVGAVIAEDVMETPHAAHV